MESVDSMDSVARPGQELRIAVVHRRVAIVIDQNQVSSRDFALMNLHNRSFLATVLFSLMIRQLVDDSH